MADAVDAAAGDEVKPYKIHVSSKYLKLTRQKLELTRLPHEGSPPKSEDWWEPKPQIEPLIDYWLDKYNWKDVENELNTKLPQFRTAFSVPSSEAPLRLHFVHARSPHDNAIPLLLIPPFPFTSLSFGHLIKPLTEPEDAANNQPFHLVIPSLPGLAYSDPLPSNAPLITNVAAMLDSLMVSRLNYAHYLATNAGAAHASPAHIDWRLARRLAVAHAGSCLGTHFVAPPLEAPKARDAPWEWAKWTVARILRAGILGYSDDDFAALGRMRGPSSLPSSGASPKAATPAAASSSGKEKEPATVVTAAVAPPLGPGATTGLNTLGLQEPNTLAYALCDSPTGLLLFVLKGLRTLGPRAHFTEAQIITLTQLAWVPGPEYALRFWAWCALHETEGDDGTSEGHEEVGDASGARKPRVAITVFTGAAGDTGSGVTTGGTTGVGAWIAGGGPAPAGSDMELQPLPVLREGADRYACPAWARAHYDVVHTQRAAGKPGLVAWERPGVLAAGIRGLAKEVLRLDGRLRGVAAPSAGVAPLERVVVDGGDDNTGGNAPAPTTKAPAAAEASTATTKAPVATEVSATTTKAPAAAEVPAAPTTAISKLAEAPLPTSDLQSAETVTNPEEEKEPTKEVGGAAVDEAKELETEKSKGKDKELSPPPPIGDPLFSDSSPDTLVVNTPPLSVEK